MHLGLSPNYKNAEVDVPRNAIRQKNGRFQLNGTLERINIPPIPPGPFANSRALFNYFVEHSKRMAAAIRYRTAYFGFN